MLKVQILSPEALLFDAAVHHATFPGSCGAFQVFDLHAPLVATLTRGDIHLVTNAGEEFRITIRSGVVEVKNDALIVLVDR